MTPGSGIVYLVGAGPGDPGLITVKGLEALRRADVVLRDRLSPAELVGAARPDAEIIEVGKFPAGAARPQEDINRLLVEKAREGNVVVRLKGGDPFVFGRGAEELAACREAGIDCVVIPGVTSAIAVPEVAGIPVTGRGVGRSFAVITGRMEENVASRDHDRAAHPGYLTDPGRAVDQRRAASASGGVRATTQSGDTGLPAHDYAALAKIDTLVLMMGRGKLGLIAAALIEAGRDPQTPAACIASGTTARQRGVVATLGTIAAAAERERLDAPVVTVIGETVGMAPRGESLAGISNAHRLLAGATPMHHHTRDFGSIQAQTPLGTGGPFSLRSKGRQAASGNRERVCGGPRATDAAESTEADSVSVGGTTGELCGVTGAGGRPLSGRRVAITQARSTSSELRRLLNEAGAEVVHCPLIEIAYPQDAPQCDESIRELTGFGWTVFTSVHGVRGFWRRMEALGRDARAFGECKVAAVGPGTARELASHGIRADLVPDEATAASLVEALRKSTLPGLDRPLRVFFPHGNLALPTVAEGLRAAGAVVREAIVYVTQDATPPRSAISALQTGVDAILFCSPSAVERFSKLELMLPGAVVGCIGPTTSAAARAAGLNADVVPQRPGSAGLVAALAEHLQAVGAER